MWTFIEFVVNDEDAERLCDALAEAIDPAAAWSCDLRSEAETFVVFPGRIVRYPRGDEGGRERAVRHARSIGVPEGQIGWPE